LGASQGDGNLSNPDVTNYVISGITSLGSFLHCVLRSFAFGKTGSMEPHDIFRVLDVNSGTEGLQVNCWNACKENQKQKNREGKTLSFNLSLPVSAFMMCLVKILQEVYPLIPPSAANFTTDQISCKSMVHCEP